MACNLPVIATDCDFGPREIIQNEENGFLIPIGDIEKLAGAIDQLLINQKLCEKFIKKGKETAKIFTVEKAINSYQNLFKELIRITNHEC